MGSRPEDGSQILRGRSPTLACWYNSSTEYLAHGSPPTWWFLGCVPFSSASGFTLVRLLAQSRTCTGPGRRTQRPAKIRTSPTRLLIIQRRTASCTSGSWVSRPTGVADGLSGPSAPELVARLGGWWAACQGPRHLGAPHRSPPPLEWGSPSDPADLSGGPPERRDDRLGFEVRVREGREVIHAEVPPRRGPRLNGNADLVGPRTGGRLAGLEHSGLEGALRLSGLVLALASSAVRQWPPLEVRGGPPRIAPPLPPGLPSWPPPGQWWWR